MFLHIGGNYLIRTSEIIGVFNVASLQEDAKGRRYLSELRQNEKLQDISEGKWSSVVLTNDEVFVTRISSATLLGRSRERIRDTFLTDRQLLSTLEEDLADEETGDSGDTTDGSAGRN